MTKVDVTFEYATRAVVAFNDKTIYTLGFQYWEVRYQGTLTQPKADDFKFDPGVDNASTGSAKFTADNRDNRNPPSIGPAIANYAGIGWR
jgi:hypothetical protein